MRLFLVRHGQTRANVSAIIQGGDDPLTDLGRKQAHTTGETLATMADVTHLYTSPMIRARETAGIIGNYVDLSPDPVDGIEEIDAGHAVGMTWEEWTVANPELAERLRSDKRSLEDRWEGGESGREFADRTLKAFDRIVTSHLGTDDVVAVVSHGGPLAWISARLHGDELGRWPFRRSDFLNCSITEVEVDEHGVQHVRVLNQVSHLEYLQESARIP